MQQARGKFATGLEMQRQVTSRPRAWRHKTRPMTKVLGHAYGKAPQRTSLTPSASRVVIEAAKLTRASLYPPSPWLSIPATSKVVSRLVHDLIIAAQTRTGRPTLYSPVGMQAGNRHRAVVLTTAPRQHSCVMLKTDTKAVKHGLKGMAKSHAAQLPQPCISSARPQIATDPKNRPHQGLLALHDIPHCEPGKLQK